MDDLDELARLHSAGAIVRHNSSFDTLPSLRNDKELTRDFIEKWVIPYYMEIGSPDGEWVNSIERIKIEITHDVCLTLLGDFNWRTRLVGAYFATVKGYIDLIDIIGILLLKSEVCCVGHVYALVLSFFNNEKSIYYLTTYLDYYLTKPELYFDQNDVMEALLYLDNVNNTNNFNNYLESWNNMLQERLLIEKRQAETVAEIVEKSEGKAAAEKFLADQGTYNVNRLTQHTTSFFDEQVSILNRLNLYV